MYAVKIPSEQGDYATPTTWLGSVLAVWILRHLLSGPEVFARLTVAPSDIRPGVSAYVITTAPEGGYEFRYARQVRFPRRSLRQHARPDPWFLLGPSVGSPVISRPHHFEMPFPQGRTGMDPVMDSWRAAYWQHRAGKTNPPPPFTEITNA